MWDPYADFTQIILENGLTLHKAYWPGRPWERFGFVVHAGARDDLLGLEGTAHFVEHVVSRNTRLLSSEIKRQVKSKGGEIDFGATSSLGTVFHCAVPANEQDIVNILVYYVDLLFHLTLTQQIEEQRQVIFGEHRSRFPTTSGYQISEKEKRILYGDLWNARIISALGSLESLFAIEREDLQEFYDRQYVPANISIVCVGGYPTDKLIQLFQTSGFIQKKRGKRNFLPEIISSPSVPSRRSFSTSLSSELKTKPFCTTAECTASIVFPGHLKPLLLPVCLIILNHLVFEEVRGRLQRSYSPGCFLTDYASHATIVLESGAIDPVFLKEVQKILLQCCRRLSKEKTLFEQYRQERRAHLQMSDVSGRKVVRACLEDLLFQGKIVSLSELIEQISDLTMEDVRSLKPWFSRERILQTSIIP